MMRPETLPPSYHRFIVNCGPLPMTALRAVMAQNRGQPLDMAAIRKHVGKRGGTLLCWGDIRQIAEP